MCPPPLLAAAKASGVGREPGQLGVRALRTSEKLSRSDKYGKS